MPEFDDPLDNPWDAWDDHDWLVAGDIDDDEPPPINLDELQAPPPRDDVFNDILNDLARIAEDHPRRVEEEMPERRNRVAVAPLPPQRFMEEIEYPEYPNQLSLDRFMTTPEVILYNRELEDGVKCYRQDGWFVISVKERPILEIGDRGITFRINNGNKQEFDAISKYSGKFVEFSIKNGMWVVSTSSQKDLPCKNSFTFYNNEGAIKDLKPLNDAFKSRLDLLEDQISRYIRAVTPEAIIKAVGPFNRNTKIFTFCPGCNNHEGGHVRKHLQRRELTLYLMYSAYQYWGHQTPLDITWKAVDLARNGIIEESLAPALKYFFRKLLASEFIFINSNPRVAPLRWTMTNLIGEQLGVGRRPAAVRFDNQVIGAARYQVRPDQVQADNAEAGGIWNAPRY